MVVEHIIERLFGFYRQDLIRRASKAVAFLGIALLLFFETVGFFLSIEANILILTALAFLTLELIETKVYDIEKEVQTQNQYQMYNTASQAYTQISNLITADSNEADKLYLISYYGRTDVKNLIAEAVENGYEVYLLLKHPSTADDSTTIEANDINESIGRFVEDVMPPALYEEHKNLRIRFYKHPVSLNAVKVSGEGIAVGWYVIASSDGQPREVEDNDKHNPMFVFTQEARDYETSDRWFRNVFNDLWEDAETPEEIYEQRSSGRVYDHVNGYENREAALKTMSQDPDPEETIISKPE